MGLYFRLHPADDGPARLLDPRQQRSEPWAGTIYGRCNKCRAPAGRPPVQVPAAEELVALGAAVQAVAWLPGEAPEEVARRWDTRRGFRGEAPPERDHS
jgi:hypothetical protein